MTIGQYIKVHDLNVNDGIDLNEEVLKVEEKWDCVHIYTAPGFYFVGTPCPYDNTDSHYEGDF